MILKKRKRELINLNIVIFDRSIPDVLLYRPCAYYQMLKMPDANPKNLKRVHN